MDKHWFSKGFAVSETNINARGFQQEPVTDSTQILTDKEEFYNQLEATVAEVKSKHSDLNEQLREIERLDELYKKYFKGKLIDCWLDTLSFREKDQLKFKK